MALERLELLITAAAGAAVKDIRAVGTATEEAAAKMTLAQKSSNLMRVGLDQVGLSSVKVSDGFKVAAAAGGVLAAVGIAKFAFESVREFASLTGEVRAFQRVTGATAEDSSRLAAAVRLTGVETKSAETGFFQLGKRIGQETDTLADYGAKAVKTKDGTVDMARTIESAAEAFQKIEDPAKRDAFVMENFGRGGAALIPILQKSRAELENLFESADKHHEIFSQEDLEKGRQFSLAMRELSDTFRGFKLELGQAVIPVVTQFAQQATTTLESLDGLTGGVGGLGKALAVTNAAFNPLSFGIHELSAGSKLLHGDFGGAAFELAKGIPIVGGITEAFFGGEEASNKFGDAQDKLKSKTAEAASLAAEGKTHTKAYRDAMSDAKDASDLLEGAQKKLAESITTTSEQAFAATQAILAQASASLTLQGNVLGVSDAMDNLTKIQEDGQKADETTEQFNRRVAESHLNVQKSILNVIGAAIQKAAADSAGLPPAEAARAKVQAQAAAINYLAATVPGAVGELGALGYSVRTLPDGKTIVVRADVGQAIDSVSAVAQAVAAIPRSVNVSVGHFFGASGGIVTRPTLAMIGESGPEALIPLNRAPGASALPTGGGGGGGTVVIPVSIGSGRALAEIVVSELNRAGGPKVSSRAVR